MSATTAVQEAVIHPAWCDRDCGEGIHWHWIERDTWRVQVVQYDDSGAQGVYVHVEDASEELSPDDARDLADAILAAWATLKA